MLPSTVVCHMWIGVNKVIEIYICMDDEMMMNRRGEGGRGEKKKECKSPGTRALVPK